MELNVSSFGPYAYADSDFTYLQHDFKLDTVTNIDKENKVESLALTYIFIDNGLSKDFYVDLRRYIENCSFKNCTVVAIMPHLPTKYVLNMLCGQNRQIPKCHLVVNPQLFRHFKVYKVPLLVSKDKVIVNMNGLPWRPYYNVTFMTDEIYQNKKVVTRYLNMRSALITAKLLQRYPNNKPVAK